MAYVLNLDTSSLSSLYGPAISTRSPVRVVATTNVNLALNLVGTVIDGVTLVANDRILLTNQSLASERGIYVIVSGAGATSRSRDCELDSVVNAIVYVNEGTVNTRTIWWVRTNSVGGTTMVFNRYLFPDTQGDVFLTTAATLTNKTLTAASNVLTARGLRTATTTVAVNGAAPPTAGQYLTATSATTANWQTGGGENNTASNLGGGVGFFKQKSGVNLEFNSLNISDARLTSSIDVNDNILISVNEGQIEFADLWSSTPISVAQGGLGTTSGTANNILRGNGAVFAIDRSFVNGSSIVGTTDTQTIIATTLNSDTNTIVGDSLWLALNSQFKNVRNAVAPTTGQIFAENPTGFMSWVTPTRVVTFRDAFQSLTSTTTTSSVFVNIHTYTTPSLPTTSNYLVSWAFIPEQITGIATGTYNVDLQIDGVGGYSDGTFTNNTGANFVNNALAMYGFVRVNLTAATHTITIRGNITGGNTLTIISAFIEITNI